MNSCNRLSLWTDGWPHLGQVQLWAEQFTTDNNLKLCFVLQVLCAFALLALAAAQDQDQAYILKQDSEVNPDGYHFEWVVFESDTKKL